MGRGSSKGSGGGGGAAKVAAPKTTAPAAPPQPKQPWWHTGANTPAGIAYDDYMKLSTDQKLRVTHDILNDPNIKVPAYLDGSDTTKFMYAIGMSNKPTVVQDSKMRSIKGKGIYRTVNGGDGITGKDITDQIRNGDYTQMSGKGGSAYGRAIYFADTVGGSSAYAHGSDSVMIKAKLNPTAKIASYQTILAGASSKQYSRNYDDNLALYALANGYDGWKAINGYHMIINRGALTISDKDKSVTWSTRKW